MVTARSEEAKLTSAQEITCLTHHLRDERHTRARVAEYLTKAKGQCDALLVGQREERGTEVFGLRAMDDAVQRQS